MYKFFSLIFVLSMHLVMAMDKGCQDVQIIYSNGPSSVGKTTLAKALQQKLGQPFLHIGIDKVIEMMPDKLNNWEGGAAPLGFSWKGLCCFVGRN
jgi:chloramphenicol 3-O-phosphotransferase